MGLNVMEALHEMGFDVTLWSWDYDAEKVKTAFHWSESVNIFNLEKLTEFRPRFPKGLAAQRTFYSRAEKRKADKLYRNYDIIFHSAPGYLVGRLERPTFLVYYDPSHTYLGQAMGINIMRSVAPAWKLPIYALLKAVQEAAIGKDQDLSKALSIPLSKALEEYLEKNGYRHSPYIYPPCDMRFKPKPKKTRVILTTRIDLRKKVEDFIEIARRLPQYQFIIVGSVSETERKFRPGYAAKVIASKSSNVQYIEKRIGDAPELLEESLVYLYTSREPGINISTGQAVGAGCIPITPDEGGGAEIVKALGVGYCYDNLDAAVACVKQAIEGREWSPQEISNKAHILSAENFRANIRRIVESYSRLFYDTLSGVT